LAYQTYMRDCINDKVLKWVHIATFNAKHPDLLLMTIKTYK